MQTNHRRGETSSRNYRRRGGKWNKNPGKSWRALKRAVWHVYRQYVRGLKHTDQVEDAVPMRRCYYSNPGFVAPRRPRD